TCRGGIAWPCAVTRKAAWYALRRVRRRADVLREASMTSRAEKLQSLGQSVWLDFIRRGHLLSGEFDRLVRNEGVVGVTSNATIFHQAVTQSDDYDAALTKLAQQGLDPPAIFDRLTIEDIQTACDHLRATF